jgi:hypothetical protein
VFLDFSSPTRRSGLLAVRSGYIQEISTGPGFAMR